MLLWFILPSMTQFCYVALGMKRSGGHNPCNHNDANKLLKAIKYYSTFVLRAKIICMYIILRFFFFNLQKIWQMAKKDFYCENNRCYYHFAAVLYVLCFCYCGHKNIHRSVLSFSHNTSNTMSRTYFTQYRVCKLTLNEVSYFFS